MPRQPRIVHRSSDPEGDDVATMMAMLLPVHSAVTTEWLADAAATAAERTLAASHTLVYFEEPDGRLGWRPPSSDLRRRGLQRAIDAAGAVYLPERLHGRTWVEPPLVIRAADGSVHPEYAAVKLAIGFPP